MEKMIKKAHGAITRIKGKEYAPTSNEIQEWIDNQPLKLYTKKMFLIAAEKCEVSMIDAEHIMKYIDEHVKPIELPSDEEVYQEAKSKGGLFVNWNMYETSAFVMGAQWMRDKIKGGEQ